MTECAHSISIVTIARKHTTQWLILILLVAIMIHTSCITLLDCAHLLSTLTLARIGWAKRNFRTLESTLPFTVGWRVAMWWKVTYAIFLVHIHAFINLHTVFKWLHMHPSYNTRCPHRATSLATSHGGVGPVSRRGEGRNSVSMVLQVLHVPLALLERAGATLSSFF